jgi:putative SOS response-associated peptidase YedK
LDVFELDEIPDFPVRYNIAPTQDVAVVRQDASGQRRLDLLRWGLVPFWTKDPAAGKPMINARSESLAERPAFRHAFRRRRCLIPADGYYEWLKQGTRRQPYYIHRGDDRPFAFAGLWDVWRGTEPPLRSCTIITTEANELTRSIHDRMPVILDEQHYASWLDPGFRDCEQLAAMLQPFANELLRVDPVSTYVNNARHEGPQCIQGGQRELF